MLHSFYFFPYCWKLFFKTCYISALNVNNFSTNRYIYVLVMGLTEIPAYLIPTPILMMIGRRLGSEILYIVAALCLLCILVIPTSETDVIILISLIGRFSASAAYGIVILYSSELFPTVNAPPFFHIIEFLSISYFLSLLTSYLVFSSDSTWTHLFT